MFYSEKLVQMFNEVSDKLPVIPMSAHEHPSFLCNPVVIDGRTLEKGEAAVVVHRGLIWSTKTIVIVTRFGNVTVTNNEEKISVAAGQKLVASGIVELGEISSPSRLSKIIGYECRNIGQRIEIFAEIFDEEEGIKGVP